MAKQLRHFTSFNAGELSPKLDARVDLAKYQNGCRELKNCIAGLYGEAERRTGFQYIASTKDSTTKARLFEWEFSTTTTYILEFGHLYVRFYSSRAQVLSGGSAYEVASPYTEDQIFELQLAQLNDVGRITHPDHPPAKLTRVSAVVWTLAYIQFLNPPVLDENTSTITITPSATSGAITLTASAPLFDAGQEAGYFRIGYLREASFEESIINADLTATGLPIIGDWNLRTYGVWSADILIQRSLDGGTTWDTIRKFSGKFDRNVDSVGEQSFEAKLRVKIENYAAPAVAGATTPRVVLEAVDAYIWGTVQIDGFTSSTVLTGTVLTPLYATTATTIWAEGAWSLLRGWPRAVTVYEQRVLYGGTNYRRQTIWGSAVDDYDNFIYGTGDTDAFAFTMAAKRQQTILWFAAQKALMVGTTSGEWAVRGDNDSSLTATSVKVSPQSEHGSATIAAQLVGDVVLFVQRNGRKIRELTFSFERDKYVAPDLNTLAEHITKSGIVQIASQQLPINVLWACTTDGKLLSMTYEREQDVVGWSEHTTDGFVESVAVTFGPIDDEVWCVIRRTIDEVDERYVEVLKPRFNPDEGDTKVDAFFVDSGLTYEQTVSKAVYSVVPTSLGSDGGVYTYNVQVTTTTAHGLVDGDVVVLSEMVYGLNGKFAIEKVNADAFMLLKLNNAGTSGPYTSSYPTGGDYYVFTQGVGMPTLGGQGVVKEAVSAISGLDHLEKKTVQILGDGAVQNTKEVTSGAIVLDDPVVLAHIGLPYTSTIKPMRLDVNPTSGVMQGMVKRITKVWARLQDSLGLKVGDGVTMDDVVFREDETAMDSSPSLFTGDKEIPFDGNFDYAGDIVITQDQPLPMTVLGITAEYEITQ
jgi:hypothetical protein